MQRVGSNRNPALDLFGDGKHGFKAGDPQTGTPATTPGAEWFNTVQEELSRAVEGAGIALNPTDLGQLLVAIKQLAWGNTSSRLATQSEAESGTDNIKQMTPLRVAQAIAALMPAGQVMPFARSTAPAGWLKCNGAAVSRTAYAGLFAAIGTTFGPGDGSTTFNLPDMRGEFVRGWDDARGVDAARAFGSAQGDELKSHTHTAMVQLAGTSHTVSNVGDAPYYTKPGDSSAVGGNETRPRNIALLFCIKH